MLRQKQKSKTYDPGWLFILVLVAALLVCLVVSHPLRLQLGGKWSLPLVGLALLAAIYLQPPVQRALYRWRSERRDRAEKLWWREREKRLQEALIRDEAIRQGRIQRERSRSSKKK